MGEKNIKISTEKKEKLTTIQVAERADIVEVRYIL